MLELHEVFKSYRSKGLWGKRLPVLQGLSYRFVAGQVTTLLGHNGAGKTTTLRLCLGLLRPDQGQVRFAGEPLSPKAQAKIGYMPELSHLPARLTASECLLLHAALYPQCQGSPAHRRALVGRSLAAVGLDGPLVHKKLLRDFSKGMGRRLAWAVATIHQPELLILDEPFSGLDPAGRSLMQQWIEAMRLQGTTLIVTGHDLAVLPQLSDQLLLLRAGRLVKTMQPQLDPPYFELSLGLNPESSRLFGNEKKLPAPTQVRSLERGHTKLSFTSQASAQLWLQACLQAELPLLAFGRVAPLQAEDMDDEALLVREKSKAKS